MGKLAFQLVEHEVVNLHYNSHIHKKNLQKVSIPELHMESWDPDPLINTNNLSKKRVKQGSQGCKTRLRPWMNQGLSPDHLFVFFINEPNKHLSITHINKIYIPLDSLPVMFGFDFESRDRDVITPNLTQKT